jgi:transketolase
MRNTFINTLMQLARKNERFFLITADMGFSVLEKFEQEFPDRFLNVGIAEQNAIGVAAGLALSGWIPVVYSIIPFIIFRCLEQIRVDVAYMNTNVKIIGVGAGLGYGPAGPTHHALEDIGIMRAFPNMTVCCPGDSIETGQLTTQILEMVGPAYLRLGKGNEPIIHNNFDRIILGKASILVHGSDIAIITTSNILDLGKTIIDDLSLLGKSASLISMHTIKPIDRQMIIDLIKSHKTIITLEEHNIVGGLGSAVAEIVAEEGGAIKLKRFGIKDEFITTIGSHQYLRKSMNFQKIILQEINE